MSNKRTPSPILIRDARIACQAIAVGDFTPIVFQRYELIGGERGIALGYPSETVDGHGCIVWTHGLSRAKATGSAS